MASKNRNTHLSNIEVKKFNREIETLTSTLEEMQGERVELTETVAKLRLVNVTLSNLLAHQKTQATSELEVECRTQLELLTKQKNAEMQQTINKKVQEWTKQKMSMQTDLVKQE